MKQYFFDLMFPFSERQWWEKNISLQWRPSSDRTVPLFRQSVGNLRRDSHIGQMGADSCSLRWWSRVSAPINLAKKCRWLGLASGEYHLLTIRAMMSPLIRFVRECIMLNTMMLIQLLSRGFNWLAGVELNKFILHPVFHLPGAIGCKV